MCASSPLAAPSSHLRLDISHVRFGSESKVEIWEWMFHVYFFFSAQKPTNKRYVWEMETSNSFLFDQRFSKYCVVFARIFHLMSHSITLLCELSSLNGRIKKSQIYKCAVSTLPVRYDKFEVYPLASSVNDRWSWIFADIFDTLLFLFCFFFAVNSQSLQIKFSRAHRLFAQWRELHDVSGSTLVWSANFDMKELSSLSA